jgi:hypothetical protein
MSARSLLSCVRARADILALGVLLVAGAVHYYLVGRGLNFFYDEWDFILGRRGNSIGAYLDPHNGHLVVVPILIYKALWATVGLQHYGPYRLVSLALHLLCVTLLFVLVRRRVGGAVAVIAATSLLFLGSAWQDLVWPSFAYLGSVAAGLGAFSVLERRDRRGDFAAALLLGLSLSCSGLGLPFLAGAAIYLLLERRSWPRLWLIAIPVIPYAVWYLHYGQSQASASNISALPSYVFDSFAGALGALSGLDTVAGKELAWLALAGIGVAIVVRRPLRSALPFASIALLFWILTGLSRAQLHEPDASRYLYLGAVVLLLVGAELARDVRVSPPLVVMLAVAVVVFSNSNLRVLRTETANLRAVDSTVAAELAMVELEKATVAADYRPDTALAPQVTAGPYLAAVRDLGSPAMPLSMVTTTSPSIRASADSALVGAILPVLVSHRPVPTTGTPPRIEGYGDGTFTRRNACVVFRPRGGGVLPSFDLVVPRRGLVIQSESTVDVRLLRFAADYPQIPSTTLTPGFSLLRPPPDVASIPWRVRLASSSTTRVCTVR